MRKPAPDLLLTQGSDHKAIALTEFAGALIADDNSENEKALEGYRRVLNADPAYTELAVKVAYELSRRNDVSSGIQVLKDAIKAAPKEPLPMIYLSQLYAKNLHKADLALKYAEQATLVAPDNFAGHLALLDLYISGNQPQKASLALERASKLRNEDPQYWVQLGDLFARFYLKENGDTPAPELQKINTIYRKAAALGRKDAIVLSKVGDYFVLSHQIKEAIPFYIAALALPPAPEDSPTNNLREKLARSFLVTDQSDEAIRLLEEITRDNPIRYETFEMLGELYEKKGDLDKAFANYEHSLGLDATQPSNYLRLSEMLMRAKRFPKAVEIMRAARMRYPDRPEITLTLGLALSQAGQHEDAIGAFEEAEGAAKSSHEELLTAQFYFQFGAVAEQAGHLEKAAGLLKRSIALDPENASQAYNYLGYMWADRGENMEEAAEMLNKALALDPENGSFLDSLGWLYFRKGDLENALKQLLRAADLMRPEDATVFDHLGDAYQALGKTHEALTYWKRALALEQENKRIATKIQEASAKVTSAVQ